MQFEVASPLEDIRWYFMIFTEAERCMFETSFRRLEE